MQAVGSGCSEATARRLLAACGNDSNKAVRLAKQALDALHRSWDQMDRDSSLPRAPSFSRLSQVRVCVFPTEDAQCGVHHIATSHVLCITLGTRRTGLTCERAGVGQVSNISADESNISHLQLADHEKSHLVDPFPTAPVQQAQHAVRVPVVLQVSSCGRASLLFTIGNCRKYSRCNHIHLLTLVPCTSGAAQASRRSPTAAATRHKHGSTGRRSGRDAT
jgi:hypothetical protein